ncbi:MAG: rhomboid family intramembrane serine protease [Candidatus Eremiobacteraeota bacterium]|nr:rhomboid family intramembrane serine protease [Candidatus Eremiobacteraeota bacterium]MBV8281801.1 rhomboid family intramembrane serine protease [Candidatus Eremiobacteraeota bacterium]
MAVVPLTDASRRPTNFPVVTLSIIVLNFIVFIVELIYGQPFVDRWSMVPANISSGQHLETLLTAMFMHGSWSHIIGNMVFFWAFGPEIEDAMGWWRYLIFYLLGGIIAGLTQVAFDPHSTIPNLGASGAIAAVMGAFLVTYPRDQIRSLLVIFVFVRVAYITSALLIGVWFLLQLISIGTVAGTQQTGGVAYLAHVGGFIFGAVMARLFEAPGQASSAGADLSDS